MNSNSTQSDFDSFLLQPPSLLKDRLKKIFFRKARLPELWVLEPKRFPQAVKSFSILLNKIIRSNKKESVQKILFTGVDRGSGVSTVAFNLALICSQDIPECKILLVDANITHPCLHKSFRVPREPGLLDFLYEQCELSEVIQDSLLPNLKLISQGANCSDSCSPFTLKSFTNFTECIQKDFDLIFFDSDSYICSAHTQTIAYRTDGLILVAEAERSRLQSVRETIIQLHQDGIPLLGNILNRHRDVIPSFLYGYL